MVDFGDILNDWDKKTAKPYGKKKLKEDDRRETAAEAETRLRGEAGDSSPPAKVPPASSSAAPRPHPVDVWLRRNGVEDKDRSGSHETVSPAERRRALRSLKPEAVIDLHGLTRDEAWTRLESFFADCRRRGFKKVLIIHGKGTHSGNGSVLIDLVRVFIERSPRAGESGFSEREAGGSGSTWVILK